MIFISIAQLQFGLLEKNKIGFFVADSASNDDKALEFIGNELEKDGTKLRLRCLPYLLNLIAVKILFGADDHDFEAYSDNVEEEEETLRDWRKYGPVAVLFSVIIHIRSSTERRRQFRDLQSQINSQLPEEGFQPSEPVMYVKTRWSSYLAANSNGCSVC